MINAKLNGTARTLALTLRARAEEQYRDAPLIEDPWSSEWFAHLPEYDDYDDWYHDAFSLATVIRTRLIDDFVAAFLQKHDDALVVELGAGLSTRYYRLGAGAATTWVELDFEEAIVVRRKLDMESDAHWFLASSMTDLTWLDKLPDYDPQNTLFVAEGALMFLEQDEIEALMAELRGRFSGAHFVFDVVNPGYIERVQESFQKLDAPMQWGAEQDDLKQMGLNIKQSSYLLQEFADRWDEIGVDKSKRSKARSGYIVEAELA